MADAGILPRPADRWPRMSLPENWLPRRHRRGAWSAARLRWPAFRIRICLIRTGGEQRISNFLLWNLAYTELYFSEVLWPEFSPRMLQAAFEYFAQRERRFGKTSAQVARESRMRRVRDA